MLDDRKYETFLERQAKLKQLNLTLVWGHVVNEGKYTWYLKGADLQKN
jgi:hypothetical protein